ncbi:hypothetical protein T07_13217 [Trichinella nelsoni]|uniref:FLYWCH-type domain-containing protein n=1 Tax=Trichinella nelsoni TaxID=6336 RepID=A0A0V0RME8_9BILA|nr:hypothetical protein T07_13217 [Trichinella nelsoni]
MFDKGICVKSCQEDYTRQQIQLETVGAVYGGRVHLLRHTNFEDKQWICNTGIPKLLLKSENEEKQAIDEQIIPFRGKYKIKMFTPRKPRCGISGTFYDFGFYEVCRPKLKESVGFLRLKEDGIWTCGTIRSNGLRGCPLMSEQALNARVIIAVEWYGNRCVTLTSTYLGVKARNRVIVKVPSIVHNCNMHMGCVGLNNMLSGLYRLSRKSRNWTKTIFLGYYNGSDNETLLGSFWRSAQMLFHNWSGEIYSYAVESASFSLSFLRLRIHHLFKTLRLFLSTNNPFSQDLCDVSYRQTFGQYQHVIGDHASTELPKT